MRVAFVENLMQDHRYKLIVAYDGTDYAGWQSQGTGNTVAEVLLKAFSEVFKSPVSLRGVSRTDAGVHALGQVVLVKTSVSISAEKLAFAWNNRLPADIVILSAQKMPLDFRLQANILEKTYQYHFFIKMPTPFVARYGWYVQKPVDLAKLQAALQLFIGTHDFRSYCTGDDWPDTVRTINSITLDYLEEAQKYRITIKGQRFLRYMIRRIVGACMQIASNSYQDIGILSKIMAEKNPEQNLLNAPAKGLTLFRVEYHGEKIEL